MAAARGCHSGTFALRYRRCAPIWGPAADPFHLRRCHRYNQQPLCRAGRKNKLRCIYEHSGANHWSCLPAVLGVLACCKLRLPAGFAPLCGLCFCMVVLQLAGSCNQLWLGASCCLWGLCSPWRSAAVTKFCPSCSPGCAGLLQRRWGADGGVRHPAAGIPDLG